MARTPSEGSNGREPGGPPTSGSVNYALPSDRHASEDARADTPAPVRQRRSQVDAAATDDPSLTELAWIVVERRWTVVAVAAAVLALAASFLFVAPATYHTSILIQVEGRSRPVAAFQDLATLFQETTPTEGEMRIMKSRTLLEAVVNQLRLHVEALPRTAPILGRAFARRWDGKEPAPARFGLARYAWGGERIRVERMDVASALLGAPLVFTALEDGRYRVATAEGDVLGEGEVGKPSTIGDGDRRVEVHLAELTARTGTEFMVVRKHVIDVIEELQAALQIEEQGRATGLVEVSMSGGDPVRIAAILDAVSANYRRQSVERTSAEAAKTLAVLEAQLPILKRNLDKAERALNDFHRKNGTVNVSLGGEDLLRRLGEIDRQISESDVLSAELTHRLTDKHWQVADLSERIERLRVQRAELEARLQQLPRLELESTRLGRQLRVATELYMLV
ncbi:MAG TPA: Wzz/FepE/Etk N-terminal domain-containing protein, partial [Anaeromyxobacteraceae bacterium]|nr:Wzz/FepE/Etk N-terminal domain-containing protein [Anaeromyxobacteraceae bacterium]